MADLLAHYLNLCSRHSEPPNTELVSHLQQLSSQPPSETTSPIVDFPSEIALYSRIASYVAGDTTLSPSDKARRLERAETVQQQIGIISECCARPLVEFLKVFHCLEKLSALDPPYPRKEHLVATVIASSVLTSLLHSASQDLTGKAIAISQETMTGYTSFAKDATITALMKQSHTYPQYTDFCERMQFVTAFQDALFSILRILPAVSEDVSSVTIQEDIFSIPRDGFGKAMVSLNDAIVQLEARAAEVSAGILARLTPENASQILPIVSSVRGLLQRSRARKIISSTDVESRIFDAFFVLVRNAQEACSVQVKSTETAVVDKILALRQNRALLSSCITTVGPLLTGSQKLQNTSDSVKDALVLLKTTEADTVKQGRSLLSTYVKAIQVSAGESGTVRLFYYDTASGHLIAGFPPAVHSLVSLVTSLASFGYDPQTLALTSDIMQCVNTAIQSSHYILALENVASFYNALSSSIRPYQKPILIKAASVLEAEIRKISALSGVDLFQPVNINDPNVNPVLRIQKLATHIEAVCLGFRQRLGKLEAFHSTTMSRIRELADLNLSLQRVKWESTIRQMRQDITDFSALLPPEFHSILSQYWTGALVKVMAKKYISTLEKNLGEIRPLPSAITINPNTVRLSPSPSEVKAYLLDQINSIARMPADPAFYVSDNPDVNKVFGLMRQLSVRYLPLAVSAADQVCINLEAIQDFFVRECAIVVLANSNSDKACAEKLPSLEDCKRLLEYSQRAMSDSFSPEELIAAAMPFLVDRSSEKGVYTVLPSGGTVYVDITSGLRLLGRKPFALQEVAISAASYHAEHEAESLLATVADIARKFDSNLGSLGSNKEFSEVSSFLASLSDTVMQDLHARYTNLTRYTEVIQLSATARDGTLRFLEKACVAYLSLHDRMKNLESLLAERKKQLWDILAARLAGPEESVLSNSVRLESVAFGILSEIATYCNACVKIRMPLTNEDANLFFRSLFFGPGDLGKYVQVLDGTHSKLLEAKKSLADLETEIQSLYTVSYTKMIADKDAKVLEASLATANLLDALCPILQALAGTEAKVTEYMRYDWPIAKSRLDILDDVASRSQNAYTRVREELNITDEEGTFARISSALAQHSEDITCIRSALLRYTLLVWKLFANAQPLCKVLRSSSLFKTHYAEICEKMSLMPIIKFFANTADGSPHQLPDLITGCAVLYTAAVNLYTNPQNLQTDMQTPEYKRLLQIVKDIILRAENEMAIRSAVDEIGYWLNSEARVTYSLMDLSTVSLGELRDLHVLVGGERHYGLMRLPLSSTWKLIMSGLVEKAAVLASVVSNPFSRSIKDQIDDASAQLEAITRLAHVLSAISRQVSVLEPVMGRGVLPDDHRKFYDSVLTIYAILLNDFDGELVLTAESTEETETAISLISVLRAGAPPSTSAVNMHLQSVNRSAQAAITVDNTPLGPYAETVIALEHSSQVLASVQQSLRQYLEAKRISFPRFFFLADGDVLEILANASARPVQTMAPHTRKLFASIDRIVVEVAASSSSITHFVSSEGETVELACHVTIEPLMPPEVWLNRLDIAIRETLKMQCLQCLQLPCQDVVRNVNTLELDNPRNFDINTSLLKVGATVSPYGLSPNDFYTFKELRDAVKKPLDIQSISGEMLCVALGVILACQVDYAIFGSERSDENCRKALEATFKRMQQYLKLFTDRLFTPQLSTAIFGTSNYIMSLKIRGLATDTFHYLAVLQRLLQTGLSYDQRVWLWTRELKYRVHKGSQDVYVCAIDSLMPYTFEYQGLPTRLIHTNLTDTCFSTLSTAIGMRLSGIPSGPAGTGKTETTKFLSSKLGRVCIVFNCDTSIERGDLSRILTGIVLSGAVGCFDEFNRLSPAVLSAVSTDIEYIQRSIRNRSLLSQSPSASARRGACTEFSLNGTTVPLQSVSPYAAIFVTMNPASREYRGRSELPYSLLRLLRGCFMGRADTLVIMETILATSGFLNAQELAEKADLTYLLASRRLPKEVHLDWGLRSLQAVLRQAALARASICRATPKFLAAPDSEGASSDDDKREMELRVLIKALADSTLSRVTGPSVDIFIEILNDIFGREHVSSHFQGSAKFGAASFIEEKLADAIPAGVGEDTGRIVLQLYRALTAKMGVALFGPTSSGKTRAVGILKESIKRATNGLLEIREFVIAPKSMSRPDLLGYVDTQTGEWTDGALTVAARQATALLANNERPTCWPIITLDGSVDPTWIEALNSVLDDNRLLTLSSGERIRFPISLDPLESYFSSLQASGLRDPKEPERLSQQRIATPVSFIFETDDLHHASPATVSRLAVICIRDPTLGEAGSISAPAAGNADEGAPEFSQSLAGLAKVITGNLPQPIRASPAAFSEVASHLLLAGTGASNCQVSGVEKSVAFALGACRAFYSAMTMRDAPADTCSDVVMSSIASTISCSTVGLRGTYVTPRHASADDAPPQFEWGVRLIRDYLAGGGSVVVAGERSTGKFSATLRATDAACISKDAFPIRYRSVVYSCSQLTARADILNFLLGECQEHQTPYGERVLSPKQTGDAARLVIVLRDADVAVPDEYGHSQMFTFLWGAVAHGRVFSRAGQSFTLQNIQFVVVVTNHDAIPLRLRRRLGVVFFRRELRDTELMLGGFYKHYSTLVRGGNLARWQNTAALAAEVMALKAKALGATNIITLPNVIPFTGSTDLGVMTLAARITKNLSPDRLAKVLSYLLECSVFHGQGRAAARADIRNVSADESGSVFTFAKIGATAQAVGRSLSTEEPVSQEFLSGLALDYVSARVRLNLLTELVATVSDAYPGLLLFARFLQGLSSMGVIPAHPATTVLGEYMKNIAAIELSLGHCGGCVVLAQPSLFSAEAAAVAALSLGCELRFGSADAVTPAAIRSVADQVANGFSRIALFVDTNTLIADQRWLSLLSALGSKNTLYFQSRMSSADLRSVSAIYAETAGLAPDTPEAELISAFLQALVHSVLPVILLSPELPITDRVFQMAPAVRRAFRIVSFPVVFQAAGPSAADFVVPVHKIACVAGVPTVARGKDAGKGAAAAPGPSRQLAVIEQIVKIASGITERFYQGHHAPAELPPVSHYERVYVLYSVFKSVWTERLTRRRDRLQGGLAQLQAAQRDVDALAREAADHSTQVEQSQADANAALEGISRKMADASQRKQAAGELSRELAVREKAILKDKEAADCKLATVLPLLEEATKSVSGIPQDALTEIKSFASPPAAVSTVLEAVLRFMGHQDLSWKGMRAFLSQQGVLRSIAAFDIRAASRASMVQVERLVKEKPECFERERIERVSRAAAPLAQWVKANMSYAAVFVTVEPLVRAAASAGKSLDEMRARIAAITAEAEALEGQIEGLREGFNAKTQLLMRLKTELEGIDAKRRKGQDLLAGLAAERARWAESLDEATRQLEAIDKCAINCALLTLLAGSYTEDVRVAFFGEALERVAEVLHDPGFADRVVGMGLRASSSAVQNAAILETLVREASRRLRVFNTFVLSVAAESTGVVAYLRALLGGDAMFVPASSESLANLASIAARFGRTLVVLDCDGGSVPGALVPYIRYGREVYRASDSAAAGLASISAADGVLAGQAAGGVTGAATVAAAAGEAAGQPGDEDEVQPAGGVPAAMDSTLLLPTATLSVPTTSSKTGTMNPAFRLFIVSNVEISVPADLSSRAVQLSFAPTQRSRIDQYTDIVLSIWSPETLDKTVRLRQTQADLRGKLLTVEGTLLSSLSDASAGASASTGSPERSLLDNADLLAALRSAQDQARDIQAARADAEAAQAELAAMQDKAVSIAQSVTQCVATLRALGAINGLYASEDTVILPLLRRCLRAQRQALSDGITDSVVEATRRVFFADTYRRLSTMVFSDDKTAALALLLRNYRPDLFTPGLYAFFSTGSVEVPQAFRLPAWVLPAHQDAVKKVLCLLPPETAAKAEVDNQMTWGSFVSKVTAAKEMSSGLFPQPALAALTVLERAALVSAIRPDLTSSVLTSACDEILGDGNSSDGPVDPLQDALLLTTGLTQPIIVYTSSGQDISASLDESLTTIIAMTPGREIEATARFSAALDDIGRAYDPNAQPKEAPSRSCVQPKVVLFKGAHLCVEWLGVLPSRLAEQAATFDAKYGAGFSSTVKVVLLLEPKPFFPKNLSSIAWRICLSSGGSPRDTMVATLREAPSVAQRIHDMKAADQPPYAFVKKLCSMLYMLAALHTVLEMRRGYAPRGVASDPGWSANDFFAASTMLLNSLGNKLSPQEDASKFLLQLSIRMSGILVDAVYGVSTKDTADRALVDTIVGRSFSQGILSAVFSLIDSGTAKAKQASTARENASLMPASVLKAMDSYPTLRYILPPFHAFEAKTPEKLLDAFVDYASRVFPDKATPDTLALPMNALFVLGEKEALTVRSFLTRAQTFISGSNGAGGSLFSAITRLADLYGKEIAPGLNEVLARIPSVASSTNSTVVSPLVDEMVSQAGIVKSLMLVLDADFKEAREAAENYLLASTRIRQISALVLSGVTPETWCSGFVCPPTPTAPHTAPELATIQPGSPESYLRFLLTSLKSVCAVLDSVRETVASKSNIDVRLSQLPRPAAFLESVRRYEGLSAGIQLNNVKLVAISGAEAPKKYPCVQIVAGNCVLQGCAFASGIDFGQSKQFLDKIVICAASAVASIKSVSVPLYIDQLRENKMAVVESLELHGANIGDDSCATVNLSGIYCHLCDR